MPEEKIDRLLDAAWATFARYGFRRTTMNDLAAAANMSRPALYLLFPNKEAIFRAVVQRVTTTSLAAVRRDLQGASGTEEALQIAFERWSVWAYALVAASPDARDLMEGAQGVAQDLLAASYRDFTDIVAEVLGGTPAARDRAEVLIAASHGFKADAPSVEVYRERLFRSITLLVG